MPNSAKPLDLGLPQPEKALIGIRRFDQEARNTEHRRLRTGFSTQLPRGVTTWITTYNPEDAERPSTD